MTRGLKTDNDVSFLLVQIGIRIATICFKLNGKLNGEQSAEGIPMNVQFEL